jgi:PilZ domain
MPMWASRVSAVEETLPKTVHYSRRVTPRAEADDGVYAFWSCNGGTGLSHVRDLNMGGVFIETPLQKDLGTSVEVYLLVGEGQIHAKALVRHVEPNHGLGLKFTALSEQDRLHFGALMRRVYSAQSAAPPV